MSILKSFSFKGLLYNKKFTAILSVALSFALWIVITVNQTPTMTKTFNDISVTINMDNTLASEAGMSIINDISTQKFSVKVIGPNHIVSSLIAADINLYASAAEVDTPGEYKLTVAATQSTAGGDYDIVSITPKTIEVNFDHIETREFTIVPLAENITAAEGYIAETPVVSGLESNNIEITGPRTVINSINTVRAVTSAEKELSASESFDAKIVVLNEKGKKISTKNLQFGADDVKVTVPISKSKTVPVKLDFTNAPENFDKSAVKFTVDHETVTVIGAPDAVDKTEEIVLTPIDISLLDKQNNEFSLSAQLPEGVRMIDAIEKFEVTVNLDGYAEKTVTVSRLEFSGLTDGFSTQKTESIKNVKICGPADVIAGIDEEKIYAKVDLSNKKAGAHAVTASISFEDNVSVWAIGSYETSVTIKKKN